MVQKRALITGVSGQDGSYLAEHLLAQGYTVVGTTRNVENTQKKLPVTLHGKIKLFSWDSLDQQHR